MQTRGAVTLALLAGMGVGAIAVQGLHAQATPPAYLIFDAEIKAVSYTHLTLPTIYSV